jgi:hypothetical protein
MEDLKRRTFIRNTFLAGRTKRQGLFVVTAFYTDHGSSDFPNKRITGSDQIILKMK